MKLAMIGFGQAGGKIVDRFLEYDDKIGSNTVRAAIAINTAKSDLLGLKHIPAKNQLLIGQSRVKGHGVGADNDLGAEIAESDIDEILGSFDDIPIHDIDAFLIVAGLGGGTGSGGAPVLARHLKRIYKEPVYGLGILPSADEGGIYTLNAARSFSTLVNHVDNLMVFDNDAWRKTDESVGGGYSTINDEIVKRYGILFTAGEVDVGDEVAESVVDSSEIINTLSGGGVSTIGYAADAIENTKEGWVSRLLGSGDRRLDTVHLTNRITSLVRKATLGRLTLPCEIMGTERALVVIAGPPAYLNRKGFERARKWLEEQTGTMEVRGGDYPLPDAQHIAAVVLLSGVTDVPRIKELQQVAIEAQQNIEEIRSESETKLEQLVFDDADELDPLF